MAKYIVKEKGEFKVVETDKEPENLVLREPNKTWSNNDYVLIENGIKVLWLDYFNDSRWKCLTIKYKGIELQEFNAVRKPQVVVDALNRYKTISDEELDKMYQKALKDVKSGLEKEVEQLKKEKQNAINEAKTYKEIINKGKELFSLIKGLEEE